MLQLGGIFAAIIALTLGFNAFTKGEVEISKTSKLRGTAEKVLGAVLILVGLAFAALALVVLPSILRADG